MVANCFQILSRTRQNLETELLFWEGSWELVSDTTCSFVAKQEVKEAPHFVNLWDPVQWKVDFRWKVCILTRQLHGWHGMAWPEVWDSGKKVCLEFSWPTWSKSINHNMLKHNSCWNYTLKATLLISPAWIEDGASKLYPKCGFVIKYFPFLSLIHFLAKFQRSAFPKGAYNIKQ